MRLGEPDTIKCAIGLMSGTSLDGVDAALLYTDGVRIERFGPSLTLPYSADMRSDLKEGLRIASACASPADMPPELKALEQELTDWHADAVFELLSVTGQAPDTVDLIGFHGQTVMHRPDRGWTWQIGDGGRLSGQTGIRVINDFRTADMKAGGQGAPLVPAYHCALVAREDRYKTVAILNLGGVANVTWISRDDDGDMQVLAFDTGPGNAIVDDWAQLHTNNSFDEDGALAARGISHGEIVMGMMASSYFDDAPPKSLDRDDFNMQAVRGLTAEDGAATLTDFIVESVVAAQSHFPTPPEAWLVCGGGRHNKTLMRRLRRRMPVLVDPVEVVGWRGDALEAEAFAFLAARSDRGLPFSYPETTGCAKPSTGGTSHMPKRRTGRSRR